MVISTLVQAFLCILFVFTPVVFMLYAIAFKNQRLFSKKKKIMVKGWQWEELLSRRGHEGDAFGVGMGIPEWKT
uniref:Uncharacterized protein n=1 Tax=Panagrellus redivivus TaxID=6233 RepID=A0A7E4UVN6_PANRE